MKFTKSQGEALKKIEVFLKEKITDDINTRVFVLKGKAGTGKTTIIREALKSLIKSDEELDDFSRNFIGQSVVGVAMAHKAKNILKKSIPLTTTFASFFGMKMTTRADGSKLFKVDNFLKRNALCSLNLDVVVHDECSMYDDKMLEIVLSETQQSTKIIFMGDPGQLPPINSKEDEDSPVFNFKNCYELKERVRQTKGNPIIELSDIIYSEIFKNKDLNKIYLALKKDNIENGIGFESIFTKDLLNEFNKDVDFFEKKILSYKNVNIGIFNKEIRNNLYSKNDDFVIGEIFYMNESFNHYSGRNILWTLYNSEEFKITKISKDKVKGFDVHLLYVDSERYIPIAIDKIRFKKELNRLKDKALNASGYQQANAWKDFYKFKESFGDISYGYAFTVYKAQGSTYKEVIVDINGIVTVGPLSDKRKLQAIYTAITRASHNVKFLKTK